MNAVKKGERGLATVEAAMVMPFLLFMTFGILQLGFLFVADAVMQYAAFCAARAEMVREVQGERYETSPKLAAAMVCSLISFGEADDPSYTLAIPRRPQPRTLPGFPYAWENTDYTIVNLPDQRFEARVRFQYEPIFPELSLLFIGVSAIDFVADKTPDGKWILEKTHTMTRAL